MTRSSGGLSTTRAGRLPEPKQSTRTSWRISSPPTTLMLCGKAYRPSHSTRQNRQLSAATQCFQTDWTSSTLVLTGSTLLLQSPFTLPPRWLKFPLPDLPPQDTPLPLVISCRLQPPPPPHQTSLWSSAVASSSSPHPPLPPDQPLVISSRLQPPPPLPLDPPLQTPTPNPPRTGPASGHQLSPPAPSTRPSAAACHQPPPPDPPSRPLPSLHLWSDAVPGPPGPPFVIQEREVRSLFRSQNPRKASGPDNVSPATLRSGTDQLAPVFTTLFNKSLEQCHIPRCFKTSTIMPVPKKPSIASLNDYRPVALTSVVMKVFERLVLRSLKAATDHQLDPHQFAYRANRSIDDAVVLALHHILQHLESSGTYARVLFVDFNSAFNTIIPRKLFNKLIHMGIERSLCMWILDFLQDRPQSVKIGKQTSKEITLNVGAPQGCVLSPLLFLLITNDSVSSEPSVVMIKFSDNTTLEGLIHNSDESAYQNEVERLAGWCSENDLELNVSKTKEMVFDFRKKKKNLTITGEVVEEVRSFKFLGTTISSDLKWDKNFSSAIKKAHQRLFFLRQLKKFKVSHSILTQFYRTATESILTFSITVWYSSACQKDKDQLERIVRTASKIIGSYMKPIASIHSLWSDRKVMAIVQDTLHPANHLFQPLPSGRRYRAMRARTSRFQNSFYPQAIHSFSKWSVC